MVGQRGWWMDNGCYNEGKGEWMDGWMGYRVYGLENERVDE